jgi:hypothetical protein
VRSRSQGISTDCTGRQGSAHDGPALADLLGRPRDRRELRFEKAGGHEQHSTRVTDGIGAQTVGIAGRAEDRWFEKARSDGSSRAPNHGTVGAAGHHVAPVHGSFEGGTPMFMVPVSVAVDFTVSTGPPFLPVEVSTYTLLKATVA